MKLHLSRFTRFFRVNIPIFWGQFKYICHIYRTKKLSIEQNDQIWPKIGIFGHFGPGVAGSSGALLVGWLVVVVRAVSRKTSIYFILFIILFIFIYYIFLLFCCNCAIAPPPPLQPAEEALIKPTALKPARSCHSLKFMHSTEFYYKIYILQICRNCSKLHFAFYGSSQNL